MMTQRAGIILASTLLSCAVAWAEPQEIASSLTLEQVVRTALQHNPQIRAMQAKWEAAQERPVQERTLPNPTFTYKGMDATKDYSFPNTNEKRMELEQSFPWFGKLGLRGRIAEKDAEIVHRDHQAMELEITMQVKETYFDLYATQRSLSITRAEQEVLKRMEDIAETRYATGAVGQQDVLKAQTEITLLEQRLLELQQQESTLKAKLNLLMNQPTDSPLGLAVTAPAADTNSDTTKLLSIAEKGRPEIEGARQDLARSRYERNLMKKEFFPDYRLGVEYRNFETGDNMVMFTVGLDLPIWLSKNRAALREADKKLESSQATLEAARQQTSFDVHDASYKVLTAQRTVELYTTALIPQAEARFSASEAGYHTGKVGFLELLESERFLLNARVMAVVAEGNLGMQMARLERAVGATVPRMKEMK